MGTLSRQEASMRSAKAGGRSLGCREKCHAHAHGMVRVGECAPRPIGDIGCDSGGADLAKMPIKIRSMDRS